MAAALVAHKLPTPTHRLGNWHRIDETVCDSLVAKVSRLFSTTWKR